MDAPMLPWMSEANVSFLEGIFRSAPLELYDVLEWGSGGSTVYFSRILEEMSVHYRWTSIEYNKKWYDKVRESVAGRPVDILLFDTKDPLKDPMDEYVSYPSTLERTFDFVLVDGRKRRRCLLEAVKLLKPSGIVALHDAHRVYYHCASEEFQYQKFIDKDLWIGSLSPLKIEDL